MVFVLRYLMERHFTHDRSYRYRTFRKTRHFIDRTFNGDLTYKEKIFHSEDIEINFQFPKICLIYVRKFKIKIFLSERI